jgi:hypothetical protein
MPNMMQRKLQKTYSFFSTVADKIGQNVVVDPSIHPSIVEIKDHVDIDNNFDFQNITTERVEKIINTINIKKATGADNIPAKVVRQCKVTVAQQLSSLINLSINTGVFPDFESSSGNSHTQVKRIP